MKWLLYAAAAMVIVIGLRPLKAASAYRFQKTAWVAEGIAYWALAVLAIVFFSWWPLILAVIAFFFYSRPKKYV